jgi:hypothetical protein
MVPLHDGAPPACARNRAKTRQAATAQRALLGAARHYRAGPETKGRLDMVGKAGFVAVLALAATAALAAAPAEARIMTFHAALDGKTGPDPTGSDATGRARIRVDTDRRLVSVDMNVEGITIPQLWAKLVARPIGPIHFHKYASAEAGSASVLVLPLPYGPNYRPTPHGIHVKMANYDYAAGAKLLDSTLSFDDFVAAMKSGLVILNVHTDKFNPGEISGKVIAD